MTVNKSASTRIAIGIEYDGSSLAGWQRQQDPQLPTVQGLLEESLSRIADAELNLKVAGRTDAGVHATAQVAHFDCPLDRGERAWVVGGNSFLPDSVRVLWAKPVADDFHARFSAEARRYMYVIQTRPVAPAILAGRVTWCGQGLDIAAMHKAAKHLPGERDFSSFRAAGCQSSSPMRRVKTAAVSAYNGFTVIDIEADGFLLHMVRNIAGSLMAIGRGEQRPQWMQDLLVAKDRSLAAPTAPPHGLYLVHVAYASHWRLPQPEGLLPPPFIGFSTKSRVK